MRKFLISLLLTFFCKATNAQMHIFVSPHFNFKSSFAFVEPASLNNAEKGILENQGFYAPYAISESHRFIKHPSFNYGFSIGVNFKNNSRLIQLGYDFDGVFFGIESSFRSQHSAIHHGHVINYIGVNIHRLSVDYSQLISKNERFFKSWINVGFGSFINTNGFTGTFPAYWDLQVATDARLIKTYFQPFEERKINGFIKIGFDNDLFIKKKYLFSFHANYIQGIGIISRSEYVHEYLINNEKVFNRTGLMSRGSGFYFVFSRRFQFYPIKKRTN